jgi:hypothetical protein
MTRQSTAVHTSHKLLLALLLLVAFCLPFILAGASGSPSHNALAAGGGVLENSNKPSVGKRPMHTCATVSTAAGQSLLNVTTQ